MRKLYWMLVGPLFARLDSHAADRHELMTAQVADVARQLEELRAELQADANSRFEKLERHITAVDENAADHAAAARGELGGVADGIQAVAADLVELRGALDDRAASLAVQVRTASEFARIGAREARIVRDKMPEG